MWFMKKDTPDRVVPPDENDALVDELRASYPYGDEAFGMRSIIHMVVWTVLEMKKRGLL